MKRFVIAASLVLCCFLGLTGCKKSSLSITSDPGGGEVFIDGVHKGTTPCTLAALPVGNYTVELRKKDYENCYAGVAIMNGEQKKIKLSMAPLTGLLHADSNPQGAEVLIDGISRGTTPLLLSDLPLGDYQLEFQIRERFLPRKKEVKLIDREPVSVMVNLDSRMAQLTAGSFPDGAEVRINGVLKGTTPTVVEDVVPGESEVKIVKKGHIPFIKNMRFDESAAYELSPSLEALPSGLTVSTSPDGAHVMIDNKDVGAAPVTLENLAGGVHEITVSMEGYASQSKVINLEPSVNDMVDFNLVKDSGILMLVTEPAGVDIYVDGKFYAVTPSQGGTAMLSAPAQILLKAGVSHRIQLFKDGFVASTFSLSTQVDQVVNQRETLNRIFVYDTMITTHDEVIKCRVEYKKPNGDIYYERFPGVYDTAEAADIVEVKTISLDDESNREARRLLQENKRTRPISDR